jgi:hypothetical protein
MRQTPARSIRQQQAAQRKPLRGYMLPHKKDEEQSEDDSPKRNKKVPQRRPSYFKKFGLTEEQEERRKAGLPIGLIRKDFSALQITTDSSEPEKSGKDDTPQARVVKLKHKPKLLKPTPLMPDENEIDNAIAEQYGKRTDFSGGVPDVSDDPDVRAAKEAAEKAQIELDRVKARKTMMRMVMDGAALDPDNVEELCKQEPWKKGDLTELSIAAFGFVPQKFEYLAKQHEEGSPEYERFIGARDEAYKLYDDQIKSAARQTVAGLRRTNDTAVGVRAAAETINARLNAFRKSAKLEGDPLLSYQSGMLMRAMILVGFNVQGQKPSGLASGKGYQQWRTKFNFD